MKRIIRSALVLTPVLLTAALAAPAQASPARPDASATGDVLGLFYPTANCTGIPDGTFDDVFLLAQPGTTDHNPIPAGAQCLTVTNLTNDPVQLTESSSAAGSRNPRPAYRCGGAGIDIPPGETADPPLLEICVSADIDIL